MFLPPRWFVLELESFDPALRVRWSMEKHMWQLERKIANSVPIATSRVEENADDKIRAREGYILVGSIPKNDLKREIFDFLRSCDLWANGGWQKMAQEIEQREADEEERRDRVFAEDLRSYSAEVYEFLKWRDGRSIRNAGMPA